LIAYILLNIFTDLS